MSEKKLFHPRTYDVYAPADIKKRWFVFWYDENRKRQRRDSGIYKHKTARRRQQAAQELIHKIKEEHKGKRLLSGTEKALRGQYKEWRARWSEETAKLRQLGIRDVVHLRETFPHLLRINSSQNKFVKAV